MHNNEIEITRGEEFSMIKRLVNKDGSPYIVAKGYNNPYWEVVVSATKYFQEDGYLLEVWSDATKYKQFKVTQCINIDELLPGDFPGWDICPLPADYRNENNPDYDDVAVFKHYDTETDTWSYRYYNKRTKSVDANGNITWVADVGWKPYELVISFQFTTEMTSQWAEQNFFYAINIVTGTTVNQVLRERCLNLVPTTEEQKKDNRYMYNKLYEKNPELVKDIDINEIMFQVDIVVPILPATKLSVVSNMKGEN